MKEINNNIQEPICSSEVSQLLKEKGFDVPTSQFYRNGELIDPKRFADLYINKNSDFAENTFITAPTQSVAVEWIRVNFGIVVLLEPSLHNYYIYRCIVISPTHFKHRQVKTYLSEENVIKDFDKPQEAIEAGLLYVLKKMI